MKSLRDEIRTDVRDKEDGFNFICRLCDRFHPGFARISPRQRRDFIKSAFARLRRDPPYAHRLDQYGKSKSIGGSYEFLGNRNKTK